MSETEVVVDFRHERPVEVGAMRSAQGAVEKNAVVSRRGVAGGVEPPDPDRVVLAKERFVIVAEGSLHCPTQNPTTYSPYPTTPKSSLDGVHDSTTDVSAVAAVLTSVWRLEEDVEAGRRG